MTDAKNPEVRPYSMYAVAPRAIFGVLGGTHMTEKSVMKDRTRVFAAVTGVDRIDSARRGIKSNF